jgi:hypothetical protein
VNDDPADPDPAEEEKLVLEAMRHLADQQLERADRLRGTARQMFAYTTGVFTLAQSAAFVGFNQKPNIVSWEQTTLLVLAMLAGAAVIATGVATFCQDKLKTVPDISEDDVKDAEQAAVAQGTSVAPRLSAKYAKAFKERREAIEARRGDRDWVAITAAVTLGFVLLELMAAFLFRIP